MIFTPHNEDNGLADMMGTAPHSPSPGASGLEDPHAAVVVVLRDERRVAVAAGAADDAADIGDHRSDDDSASPERDALLADIVAGLAAGPQDPARQALVVARDERGGVVALGGYRVLRPGRALAVCTVDRAYQRVGLGTFLLRRLAAIGLVHGVRRFRVDVVADAMALADLLRDSGLRSRWNLARVSHVDLELRGRRPGWATPDCRTAAATRR